MELSIPPRMFKTIGFDLEVQSFIWTIKNFPFELQSTKITTATNPKCIDFTAGEKIGPHCKSTWIVKLAGRMLKGKRWIDIVYHTAKPELNPNLRNAYVEMTFGIQKDKGDIAHKIVFPAHPITSYANSFACTTLECIGPDKWSTGTKEDLDLVINVNFKLYVQSAFKNANSLLAIMEEFRVKLSAQARKDCARLQENSIPFTAIKIVSNDQKEFSMPVGILAVRNDVFAAMLRADVTKGNSGVIHLPDISSKALPVLLDFFCTGELHPEWSRGDVIVELTKAAGKYQQKDLLQFLDLTMGKVAQLENVGPLVTLARQLSLKVAEEELLTLARRKVVEPTDNSVKIIQNTERPATEPRPTAKPQNRCGCCCIT